jgi:hypothetical protein
MKASAEQRPPKRVPFLRSPVVESPSYDDDSQLCGGQQPFLCSEEQKGEEAASPGNQSRKRVFWKFPPRPFPLENRRLPLALPQSTGPAKNSHVSLPTLSVTSSWPAIQKTACAVKKLWRMRLPCGSPRKSKTQFCKT